MLHLPQLLATSVGNAIIIAQTYWLFHSQNCWSQECLRSGLREEWTDPSQTQMESSNASVEC